MCSVNFVDLSGLYILPFHFLSCIVFHLYKCSICPRLTEYVEMRELWMNTYNLHL